MMNNLNYKVGLYCRLSLDDGSGRQENSKPKFYLIEKDEYIVLNVKDVELGETYIIRFYPNTKICEVIERIS